MERLRELLTSYLCGELKTAKLSLFDSRFELPCLKERGRVMLRLIRNAWIRTLIAFDVHDPLERTGKAFALPNDFNLLDAQSKTRASICNLFGNLQQPIDQLARLYD